MNLKPKRIINHKEIETGNTLGNPLKDLFPYILFVSSGLYSGLIVVNVSKNGLVVNVSESESLGSANTNIIPPSFLICTIQ